jgi:hypothetical protein
MPKKPRGAAPVADLAEQARRLGGPIFDYSLTTPNADILRYYHPYPEHLANYDRVYRSSTRLAELAAYENRPLGHFMRFLDALGIDRICVKARDLETTFGLKIPNETVAKLVRAFPGRVIGFAGADPHKGMAAVRELERAVRTLGLRGLNLQLYEHKLPANDKKLYPLYAKACELDIAVNVHVSINFSTRSLMAYGNPAHLDEVAVDFPELRLVAGPPGWPWVEELVGVAWRHPNVYIAIESVRPALLAKRNSGYEPLFAYGNGVLSDKVIFGSGWPLIPLRRTIQEMMALPWKPEVLPLLFRENGLRALGLSPR